MLVAATIGTMGLVSAGCNTIDGGAVEGRWVVRDSQGRPLECENTPMAFIRLAMRPIAGEGDPCTRQSPAANSCGPNGCCAFDCVGRDGVGATPFVIPEGDYAIVLEPLDSNRMVLGPQDGIIVPPTTIRTVTSGAVTNLNVSLVIVESPL